MITPRRRDQSRSAFTLIELLVVISILAVLAAASIPVIGIVKQSANSARSIANLRQLGAALGAYQADKGRYPAIEGESPIEQVDNWVAELIIVLNPEEEVLDLAADPPTSVFVPPGIDWQNPTGGGRYESHEILNTYAATDSLVGFDYDDKPDEQRGRRPESIDRKSESILLVEAHQQGNEPTAIGWIDWSTAKSDLGGDPESSGSVDFRYRNRVNGLMADFSAKSLGGKKDTPKITKAEWQGHDYPD